MTHVECKLLEYVNGYNAELGRVQLQVKLQTLLRTNLAVPFSILARRNEWKK